MFLLLPSPHAGEAHAGAVQRPFAMRAASASGLGPSGEVETMNGSPPLAEQEEPEDHEFMQKLRIFLKKEYNVELDLSLGWKTPTVGGQKLDLSKLYREVVKRGGHKEVTVTKQWKQVADAFKLPKSLTSSSFLMRTHYERFLYEFESRHFLNKPTSDQSFNSKLISPSWSLPNNHQVSGAPPAMMPPSPASSLVLPVPHAPTGAVPVLPISLPSTSAAESPKHPFTPTATKPSPGHFPLLPNMPTAVAPTVTHYPGLPLPPSASTLSAVAAQAYLASQPAHAAAVAAAAAAAAVAADLPPPAYAGVPPEAAHTATTVPPTSAMLALPPPRSAPIPALSPTATASPLSSYVEPAPPVSALHSTSTASTSQQGSGILNVQQLQMILQAAHDEALRAVQPSVQLLEERLQQVEGLHHQLALLVKNASLASQGQSNHDPHANQENGSNDGSECAPKKGSSTDSIGDDQGDGTKPAKHNGHGHRGFAPYERHSHPGSYAHGPHSLRGSAVGDGAPGHSQHSQGCEVASYSDPHQRAAAAVAARSAGAEHTAAALARARRAASELGAEAQWGSEFQAECGAREKRKWEEHHHHAHLPKRAMLAATHGFPAEVLMRHYAPSHPR